MLDHNIIGLILNSGYVSQELERWVSPEVCCSVDLIILLNLNVVACVVSMMMMMCCVDSYKIHNSVTISCVDSYKIPNSVTISRSLHLNMFSQELALTV